MCPAWLPFQNYASEGDQVQIKGSKHSPHRGFLSGSREGPPTQRSIPILNEDVEKPGVRPQSVFILLYITQPLFPTCFGWFKTFISCGAFSLNVD